MHKIYVKVVSECDAEGFVGPLAIHWADGSVFTIDKVLDVRNAASLRAGGLGTRYTVRISCDEKNVFAKDRYLFYEVGLSPHRWFVEGKGG